MEALTLRKLEDQDLLRMKTWLQREHVRKWYHEPQDWIEEIEKRTTDYSFITHFIVCLGEKPIGFCQYYLCEMAEEEWYGTYIDAKTYSIDYLIGETDFLGCGLGKQIVALLVDKIFNFEQGNQIIVQPEQENLRSCHALLANDFLYDEEQELYYKKK